MPFSQAQDLNIIIRSLESISYTLFTSLPKISGHPLTDPLALSASLLLSVPAVNEILTVKSCSDCHPS